MDKQLLLSKINECNNYIQYAVRKCLSKEDAEKYRDYRLYFHEEKGEDPGIMVLTLSLRAPDPDSNEEQGIWQCQLKWNACDNKTVLEAGYRHIWYQWQGAVLFQGIIHLLKNRS